MFFENWMSYINDETAITRLAIPATHNSCTMGMNFLGRCQNDSVLNQYNHGIRKFGVFLNYTKGKVRAAHSVVSGIPGDEIFRDFGEIIRNHDDFLILNVRSYPDQKIGPYTYKCLCEPERIDELIEKYLEPEKYAFTNTDNLKKLTVGDIRKSGKRFIINNERCDYKFSRDFKLKEPWDPKVFGYKPEKFTAVCLDYLRNEESDGFLTLQTQLTPGPGTENGITKWPKSLEKLMIPYFPKILENLANEPALVEKVNIISGDFMTDTQSKINGILALNLLKGAVKEEMKKEYAEAIGFEK